MKKEKRSYSERDVRQMQKNRKREALVQDLALLGFLVCLLAEAGLVAAAGENQRTECIVMFLLTAAGIVFAAYRFQYLAVVFAGLETFFYAVYKIYMRLTQSTEITWISYAWLVLPLTCVCMVLLFMRSVSRADAEMELMDTRLRDMVLMEPVTGLFNLRSMYADLERQFAYAKRNHLPVSLLLIELRYPGELKAILTDVQFDLLKRRLAEYVEDKIRLEDRPYAINDEGGIGVICTCNLAGVEIVKGRIKNALLEKSFFEGITDRAVRIEIRTGSYEYSEEISSAMELKQKAENEMQYDV